MGLFDHLLTEIEESDRPVLQKYPKIAERINQLDEKLSGWELWRKEHWDDESNSTKAARAALEAKDAEIEALKILQGTDMTWDDIKGNVEALLKQQSVVTRDQFEKEFAPKLPFAKADDLKPLDEKIKNLERGMEYTYAKTAHLPAMHAREFGEVLKIEDLFKHMTDNKITDFEQGYASLAAPLRAKKAEEVQAAREVEIRKEVREETLKEVTMRGGALPVDNKGTAPEVTPIARKIADRRKEEIPGMAKLTQGELGSGAATQDAYGAYLKDQASGEKPKLPSWMSYPV